MMFDCLIRGEYEFIMMAEKWRGLHKSMKHARRSARQLDTEHLKIDEELSADSCED